MEKTVQNIPFLRVSIAFALGIYLGSLLFQLPAISLAVVLVLLLAILFIFKRLTSFNSQLLSGVLYNLIFVIAGIYLYQSYNDKPVFYEDGYFYVTILEPPQEKKNSYQAVAEINSFVRNDSLFDVKEQIIIYFSKENRIHSVNPGSNIFFKSNPQRIKNFGNPYEFDYQKYLDRKRIYRQVYLDKDSWWPTGESEKSIVILAENFRQKLLAIYKQLPINEKERKVLSALTLGYKRDLTPDTKRVFSSAGAMHVLAVSGLHVGIIFWFVILLFGFLRKTKNGRILFTIITLSILWAYAFITGLSPSVLRATTMFSIFTFGELINRKSNVFNLLLTAAFILLVINPNNLFETGFQLSFSAVFGILFLQPKIGSIVNVRNRILSFLWDLFTISIAAQLATLPFTLYYFSQFPTYFFISNMIIIPAIMALIPLGMSILIISKFKLLATIIATIVNGFIKIIFHFLTFIEQLPASVIDIPFSRIQQLLLVFIIISFFVLLKSKKTIYIHAILAGLILITSTFIIQNFKQNSHNELIVYNNSNNATIELIHGKANYVISESELSEDASVIDAILTTTQKQNLKPPIFFTIKDSTITNFMFLKNNLICFEGKTIIFGILPNIKLSTTPDFIINPHFANNLDNTNHKITHVITNNSSKYNSKQSSSLNQHYTYEMAFQKIW